MANEGPKRAVALRYDSTREQAPRVVAKGRGVIAERIIELARENSVPVREDANLVRVLGRLELDREIPPELYQAVAIILAFLYKTNSPGS